ncbi:restriction endonuclease subunit S [Wenyingzhuangia sp. IMCC45467]
MAKNNKTVANVPNLRFPNFKGDWQPQKLGEIAQFSKGKGISKLDIVENGTTKCIRYGELYTDYSEVIDRVLSTTNIEESKLVISKKNDVIIPSSGETPIDIAKASCVIKSGIALGGDLNIIKTDINGVFLSYYLNSKKRNEIASLAQGSSVVHLYSKQLSKLNLCIPLEKEQNKLAYFLITIDNRISTQIKIIQSIESLMSGLVQDIFSQKLRFKNDEGNEFPDWVSKKLSEIGEIITGKTPKTSDKKLWNGNIDFVTPTDIIEGEKYQIKTSRKVKETESIKILPKGAILYTCIASIGKITITKNLSISNQQINSLIVKGEYSNEFVYYALLNLTPKIKATQSTTTLPIINKTDFSKFKINLPSLTEQTKIANFLSSIDEKINKEKSVLEQYQQQKKYLLQNLFI